MAAVLKLENIHRSFRQGGRAIEVLRGAALELEAGEVVGLLGPSGSGKSTLLHIAGLLEAPDKGEVWIGGKRAGRMGDEARTLLRRESIGFVYQFHHLLKEFTAAENVMLPLRIRGLAAAEARPRAEALLKSLGLAERLSHWPSELSGGEQQRVAIARAFANAPMLILADEPTGNLDEATAARVMDAFIAAARKGKTAALIATHNTTLAKGLDRRLFLHEGRISARQ
ncbi:MAG TPA: ABC transporter ATP-binding protein [Sphingomonadales bacterium]|nr:ABC transporter ATP-binding protein [Sphingomonadales bacterium]